MKDRILAELKLGKANAISKRQLANRLGQRSDRGIRKCIEAMRLEGVLIGSSSKSDGGYYICETWEEIQDTLQHIKPRAFAMFAVMSAMERAGRELQGQMRAM
jgi:biotin operon repressor